MTENIALCLEDDFGNGAETIEIVFGIVLAVGLGAALIAFQGTIKGAFTQAQKDIGSVFSTLSAGSDNSAITHVTGANVNVSK